ncbi:phosphotransferase [Nocardioides bigeumensis]|uniref:Phosphotransferase n=2 Tax=Nocardioides bigeumensis TaxID=433657 RepID=A0ABN2Y5C4_9ACTN
MERWREEKWLAGVHTWVDERLAAAGLACAGEAEQRHVTPWSTVIRVPTTGGDVWFKANDASMHHESRVVGLLAAEVPDLVPPLIADDTDRGWLLMADAGEWLRSVSPREGHLDHWLEVLPAYAAAQLAMRSHVEDLLSAGVPDRRLPTLVPAYAALMDEIDAEPRFRAAETFVGELVERLAEHGINETLNHDDLHDGQVFVRSGGAGGAGGAGGSGRAGRRVLVMDWGDACVSHPFFTMSVTLQGVLSWGLDDEEDSVDTTPFLEAYLGPFRAAYPGVTQCDLAEAARVAMRLGWACRAVNGHVPGDPGATVNRLKMFVDGRV